ncbi:MAG: LuxR C-terminal-related transcriptional regulator [Brachymonas sp.]|jgi:DNA-binding NarL/FixJ family response regulator
MTAAHCLIVEDLPQTARWLEQVVAQAFPALQVRHAASVQAAKTLLAAYCQAGAPPLQLILLDLGLPDGCGGDLLPWLAEHLPQTAAVVATIYDDDAHVFAALAAGAKGYLLKDESADALVQYLGRITRGEPPLSPAIARRILLHFQTPAASVGAAPARPQDAPEFLNSEQAQLQGVLSPRERQTLQWIAQGYTVAECAKKLELSPNTVAGYVKSIYYKLQISTRAEATREAIKRGLI